MAAVICVMDAPKVMLPLLWCWPTMSESDVDGMTIEVELSTNIPLRFVAVTDSSNTSKIYAVCHCVLPFTCMCLFQTRFDKLMLSCINGKLYSFIIGRVQKALLLHLCYLV